MKKFALAVRKVSEGGSGSGDEGSPKKGDKGKKPTEPEHFADVNGIECYILNVFVIAI